jgi:hypothetical protein
MINKNDVRSILSDAPDSLKFLWEKRDTAMEYEKQHGLPLRTSKRYLEAQAEVDNYFLPKEPKAQRKKPKKKVYMPDPDWAY